ncbi:hypothetical protein L1049_016942 [Liquidambar formosana]|uniref:Uncharacterized protein n=1 Tax=Liquidambar formosana TaxID=63359 RepID=A0AAP0S7E2_LIQFO
MVVKGRRRIESLRQIGLPLGSGGPRSYEIAHSTHSRRGIKVYKNFGHKELCCLSISSKRLRILSEEHALWFQLLLLDFPGKDHSSGRPPKTRYKILWVMDKSWELELSDERFKTKVEKPSNITAAIGERE